MKNRSSLILLVFLVPVAGAAAGYFFLLAPAKSIAENEQAAAAAIKTLASAEADFRSNDRDGNHVNDFWTGDVAGLYSVRSSNAADSPEIRLIVRELAEADAKPLKPLVPKPVPHHGYYFIALEEDAAIEGSERLYKQDTEGKPPMGKVHNPSRFGFCAYPAEYGVTGKSTFLLNENNIVVRRDVGGKPMTKFPKE